MTVLKEQLYLEFIRRRKCLVCRKNHPDAHHVRSRGAGGSDYDTVPLCRKHHTELHQIGQGTFQSHYNMNLYKDIVELNLEFKKLWGVNDKLDDGRRRVEETRPNSNIEEAPY